MTPNPVDVRLPCFEGLLILNRAILSEGPQTSNGTAWTETWCSLEDGKLLVYKDRTAAIISPEHTSAVIDIGSFACVQLSTASPEHGCELVLSTALPESNKLSRLFQPKSALSLNRLHLDSPHDDSSYEPPSRTSTTSFGRASFQSRPPTVSELSTLPTNVIAHGQQSTRSKPWSKISSGPRKFYSKVSSASNGSSRFDQDPAFRSDSTPSSRSSIADTRASTDLASIGDASPCTTFSTGFSHNPERVVIRATTPTILRSWSNAFALTIKMHNEIGSPPPPMPEPPKRVSTRPSLGNLPGFRTRASQPQGRAFPSQEASYGACVEDAPPKVARKRQSSSTSFSPALRDSQNPQNQTDDDSSVPVQYTRCPAFKEQGESVANLEHVIASERLDHSLDTSNGSLYSHSHTFGPHDTKRWQSTRSYKRSNSTTSSPLLCSAADMLPINRRNSVSVAHLLSYRTNAGPTAESFDTSFDDTSPCLRSSNRTATRPHNVGITEALLVQNGCKLTPKGTLPASRHRRSGSLLQFGPSRILAWKDSFTPIESSAPTDTTARLRLKVNQGKVNESSQASGSSDGQLQNQTVKRFPRFVSLRSLTASRPNGKEDPIGSNARHDVSRWSSSTSEPRESQDILNSRTTTLNPKKTKGKPRTASLLTITKNTINSLRQKSSPRQQVGSVSEACPAQDDVGGEDCQGAGAKIPILTCDPSSELVTPTHEASASASSSQSQSQMQSAVFGAAIRAGGRLPVSIADEIHRSEAAAEECTADADATLPEEMVRLKLDPAYDEGDYGDCLPSVRVERILPPEQIIKTFDELRAASTTPATSSGEWLDANRGRDSLDWGAAVAGFRRPSLRLAASQTFQTHATGARLRSISTRHWNASDTRLCELVSADTDKVLSQPRLSADAARPPHSLPAPPRALKRRPRSPHLHLIPPVPSKCSFAHRNSSPHVDPATTTAQLTPQTLTVPPASRSPPRRLGTPVSKSNKLSLTA